MNSQTPTARLVKIIRSNGTLRVSNVIKHNGEFTKSPPENLKPGCRTVSNNGSGSGLAPAQNILAVQVWFGFT